MLPESLTGSPRGRWWFRRRTDGHSDPLSDLPTHSPAAICVIVHTSPETSSVLPATSSRAGLLPAKHAGDGAPLRSGTTARFGSDLSW
jgi:hypothetical protein